eukprot:2416066-Rhodomonas_salina.10
MSGTQDTACLYQVREGEEPAGRERGWDCRGTSLRAAARCPRVAPQGLTSVIGEGMASAKAWEDAAAHRGPIPLCSYALPMPCPVLAYALPMPCLVLACPVLAHALAMPCWVLACALAMACPVLACRTGLHARYAGSGTEKGYAATRRGTGAGGAAWGASWAPDRSEGVDFGRCLLMT